VSNTIPPHRPAQLSPPELRQLAATTLRASIPDIPPRAASLAIDAIDAAVWGMLGSLGMTPREAAVIADFLWAAG
jgi:hypothetical protein